VTRVVCVGLAVLDVVFEVEHLPAGSGKNFARALRHVGGGPAANGAVTVSRLGGSAAFVGAVGDDVTGTRIAADLAAEAIDTTYLEVVAGTTSPTSAVLVDAAGERMIVNHLDPSLHAGAAADASAFVGADAVLADLRWPAGAQVGLEAAAASGVPGVLDYDLTTPIDDAPLLAAASHIAFAAPALAARSGTSDPADGLRWMAERTDAWVAVTVGADGVYWLDDGTVRHLPAFSVEVVDTLGAGDVFHGALALALANGRPPRDAVHQASAAAALKCTRPGGRAGIPDADALTTFLTNQGR
jgi:sulfofructose kinase